MAAKTIYNMPAHEFRALRMYLGISSYKLAPLLELDPRTVRRYEQEPGSPGARCVPEETAKKLLKLARNHVPTEQKHMKTPEQLVTEWAKQMAAIKDGPEQAAIVLATMVSFISEIQHDAIQSILLRK